MLESPFTVMSTTPSSHEEDEKLSGRWTSTNSKHNMDSSPFSGLPAELREQIFSLALHQPDGITFRKGDYWPAPCFSEETLDMRPHFPTPYPLALAQTCRTIRNESAHFFYTLNIFRIECETEVGPWPAFQRFLDLMGHEHIAELSRVVLLLEDSHDALREHLLHHCRDATLEELVWLRQWCLQRPHIRLDLELGWPWCQFEGAVAVVRLQALDFISETDQDLSSGEFRRRMLEDWMVKLRAVTLETGCTPYFLPSNPEATHRRKHRV